MSATLRSVREFQSKSPELSGHSSFHEHDRPLSDVREKQVKKHKEGDTVLAILQFLHAHRIPAWRMNTGATKIGGRFLRFGVVGMADIIGILPRSRAMTYYEGRFLAIEVKSQTGKMSVAQQGFLTQVNAAGGKAFVARSVSDVERALAELLPAGR